MNKLTSLTPRPPAQEDDALTDSEIAMLLAISTDPPMWPTTSEEHYALHKLREKGYVWFGFQFKGSHGGSHGGYRLTLEGQAIVNLLGD